MTVKRVALLTAGGYAPCLSSAVGGLIERYTELDPSIEIIAYRHGYWGLLSGEKIIVDQKVRRNAGLLHQFGGSPIGNSRVKLTNTDDLVKRGLIKEGENALQVAAEKLKADGVDVLHTIGGDDTNTTAADLAAYLHEHDAELRVVGLPKTIDNDIVPVRQSLGALTAAEQTSQFAQNIIAEHGSNPRMLIIHEIMGRACGYLTAEAARFYQQWHAQQQWLPEIGLDAEKWDVHAVFLPELKIDIDREAKRLKAVMDEVGNVNIFLSEGAGIPEIVAEMEANGEEVPRDPFGHVKLDTINPGNWFAKQFADKLGAEKVMVQKSGYFARSAKANAEDLRLIKSMTDLAVQVSLEGGSGVIGHDEGNDNRLRAIEFDRIAGHKSFNVEQDWFQDVLVRAGQPFAKAEPSED
ncbi:pyrophosphate--fructose-6-phosphate 1-phosphotransferase [Helcobacillus massiliensis]|uniref:pyrophosphate--fructose-6-phosphate 1-phosphotransferase n=1 Tax=Helcobacillus massiliensis TaxID=521392 RepID=UPI0021A442FE|nr:pyrophosphate--fructose-6-phosphate 1-phosphotransferase [Helcobacillus massiliensis]MCT1557395.1 pyrophosphate--fructose-6-phosphate 1-phosphotransferase [Helcobacillus massiliensis]MCT2036882.1 pyrophosphate--fructose-6-phosphate 1-phosphotransferase [Helcobacillus massiliensis]MCT2331680.1 pyrophosphate--fructose-6-phosphate 1-phosphotransferase [Helcobacillus massiliensis]